MKHPLYNIYSQYLVKEYGEKVYKIPINLPVSCPNRDGNISMGDAPTVEKRAGFESLSNQLSVKEQLKRNIAHISKKYKANKFIAYLELFKYLSSTKYLQKYMGRHAWIM